LIERTDEQWLSDLKESSPRFDFALKDLRILLIKGLRAGVSKWKKINREDFENIVEESLIKIIKNLDSFKGHSRFTTWALKIGVNTALTELRHRRWKDVSLDEIVESKGMKSLLETVSRPSYSPEKQTIQRILMNTINKLIRTELTERQRKAMLAVRFYGMPLEEVARQMGTNRNNLYKLLHDARLRLKEAISKEELSLKEILDSFGSS
jgi:RNA polymerase sigma-70 factor (ECF subfamily)